MAKILVVDDEDDVRGLVKMILQDAGFHALVSGNGEEAIQVAKAEGPDLILLDLVMPGRSGLEVCRVLKSDPKTSAIPIVMFTVLSRGVDKELMARAGADGRITKPFTAEGLVAEIKNYLEMAGLDKFSRQLGLKHSQIRGRKILLEINSAYNYEKAIEDLVIEAGANKEAIIVVTRRGSTLHQKLEGDRAIEIHFLSPSLPVATMHTILQSHQQGQVNIILDSLTDLAISSGFERAYSFTRSLLEQLSDDRITAFFLLNPDAHYPVVTQSFKGLFGNQAACDEGGMRTLKWTPLT